MHAAILSKLTGDPSTETLESHLENGVPAAEVERTDYLDGRTIHNGTLAGHVTTEEPSPIVTSDGIYTEPEATTRMVVTDFYADLEGGWAGVDTSDGEELLASYLAGQAAVMREDAAINLGGWVEAYERRDGSDVWGLSFSQSIDDGFATDRAGARYHDDAEIHMIPQGVSAVGFQYHWNNSPARGMIAESGYVAVYDDWPVDRFARWVAEEIEPYLEYDRDEQQTLSSGASDESDEEFTDEVERYLQEEGLDADRDAEVQT